MPAFKSMKKSKILIKILQSIIIPRYSKKNSRPTEIELFCGTRFLAKCLGGIPDYGKGNVAYSVALLFNSHIKYSVLI